MAQARRRQTAGSTSHSIARVSTPGTASSLPSGLNAFRSPRNGRVRDGMRESGLLSATSSSAYGRPVDRSQSLVSANDRLVVARNDPVPSNDAPAIGGVWPGSGG